MIYLFLTILCGAAISIVMRLSEGHVRSRMSMLASNYVTCMLMAFLFMGPSRAFAPAQGMSRAVGMGLLNGFFYMSALVAMQYNIRRNGVVLPSVFSKMGGLLLPLIAAILIFGEAPRAVQAVGFVLSVAAILMMNKRREGERVSAMPALLVLLFMDGMAAVMSKVYREVGVAALSDHFLFFTFGSAFVLCAGVLILKREKPGWMEVLFGIGVGVPNFLASHFNLKALETLPAIIVYPSRSVGSLMIITLVGLFIFREKLSRRQMVAMVFIFAALILLNL